MTVPVALSLGSNLGDRRSHLSWAIGQLSSHVRDLRASSFIETEPVDVPDTQPPYLNAAVVGHTALDPRALMNVLLEIEKSRGRERLTPRAARTLDLDLIFYGDQMIHEPGLVVPHPHFRDRAFVLEPLMEIAGDWVDPVTGKNVAILLGEFFGRSGE